MVEAVAEDEQIKTDVFTALDKVVQAPDAILASNTSSIPIMKLGMATARPQQVIGVHFFNPVPVLQLVELVPSLLTDAGTQARAEAFVEGVLGKKVIKSQDRAGFVVNALLVPYLLSAIRMMESGFAEAADIDNGMVRGLRAPDGPARADRPDRPGHHQGHRRVDVRGVQGAAVLAAAAAAAHGRRGAARQEERQGLLLLPDLTV